MAMNDVDWANIFAALGGSAPGQEQQQQGQVATPDSEAAAGEWPNPNNTPIAPTPGPSAPIAGAAHLRQTHSTSSSFSISHDPPRGIGTQSHSAEGSLAGTPLDTPVLPGQFYWPPHAQHPQPQQQAGVEWPPAPPSSSSAGGPSGQQQQGSAASVNVSPPQPRVSTRSRPRSSASAGSNTPPSLTPIAPAPAPGATSRRGSTIATPAAEEEDVEDKRVRNTLASARFRAKKKLQLEATERAIKSLEGQAAQLEVEVGDLRKENGLLRDMVGMKYRLQQ